MEASEHPEIRSRKDFRAWLEAHAAESEECWIAVRRGRPEDPDVLYYLDAVEEALCFGWIDSTQKAVGGLCLQRFTPRRKNSPWSELNKERVRRLERLGLMTDAGRAVLPPMGLRSYTVDPDVRRALKEARAWSAFMRFPPLYRRIRSYNTAFLRQRDEAAYGRALARLVEETKKGRMYGAWDDYGRLTEAQETQGGQDGKDA